MSKTVVINSFLYRAEADILVDRLHSAGIKSKVKQDKKSLRQLREDIIDGGAADSPEKFLVLVDPENKARALVVSTTAQLDK